MRHAYLVRSPLKLCAAVICSCTWCVKWQRSSEAACGQTLWGISAAECVVRMRCTAMIIGNPIGSLKVRLRLAAVHNHWPGPVLLFASAINRQCREIARVIATCCFCPFCFIPYPLSFILYPLSHIPLSFLSTSDVRDQG
jgi:hypothetical protein